MGSDGVKIGIVLDIVLALIFITIILFGIRKGLIKMIRGLLSLTLMVVISLFAAAPVTNLIGDYTTIDEKIATELAMPLNKLAKFEEPYLILTYYSDYDAIFDEEGNEIKGLVYLDENGSPKSFDDLLEGASITQIFVLQSLVKEQATTMLIPDEDEEESQSQSEGRKTVYLIDAFAYTTTVYIMITAVDILLFIIGYILFRMLFSLFQKMANRLYLVHFINKALGAVFGMIVGGLIIYLILTIMMLLQNVTFMEPINLGIESSYITKHLYKFDGLYLFIKDFSIFDLINKTISNILPSGS